MVLPLQTWQYSDPKRLWPLLGGLSVLAHVGVLGLSLPYVLELMEPTGDRAATSSTPVELIVVDESVPQAELPTADEETTEASVAEESSASATESSRPVRASADGRPSAISPARGTTSSSVATPTASDSVSSPVSSANDPVSSGASGATAEQTPATTQPDSPLPAQETGQEVTGQGPEPTTESPLGVSTDSASQSEESQSEESQSSDWKSEDSSQPESSQSDESQIEESASESGSAAATTDEPGFSAESSEAEGAAGQSENSESEPPVVEGEQLPAPGTTLSEEAPQVAALQVLDTDINTVQDQKDVPPRLLDDSGTITLQPESLGCGDVDFAQGPLTYRLAINADSTLRTVTPVPLDERGSVQAVACLIRSAGFSFEAAISDGSPVLDDSLLMTVQVIESPLE